MLVKLYNSWVANVAASEEPCSGFDIDSDRFLFLCCEESPFFNLA